MPVRTPPDVDICILTFRRADLLAQLLDSVAAMEVDGMALRIVVVDNDPAETARDVITSRREAYPFELEYACEPRRGIANARNRALDSVSAPLFAFLDDDEVVEAGWLRALVRTISITGAHVVFGPVLGQLPEFAPAWARQHPAFARPRRPTGTPVIHGGCGNVLIRTAALGTPALRFDADYGLTGGEDTEFFNRLRRTGATMVWCDEAVVREHVPPERLSLRWLGRRAFASGQVYVRVYVSVLPPAKRLARALSRTCLAATAAAAMPLARLVSESLYARLLTRLAAAAGELSVLLGTVHRVQPYGESSRTDG